MAAAKVNDTCADDKVIMIIDGKKVLLPPPNKADDMTAAADKFIMINDDNKVLPLPPPDAKAHMTVTATARTADKIFLGISENIWMGFVLFLFFSPVLFLILQSVYRHLYPDTSMLPKFHIQSVHATPIYNASSLPSSPPPKISAINFNFTFFIAKGYDYGTILYKFDSVSLYYYDGVFLTNTTLKSFFQGPDEQSTVEASFNVGPAAGVEEWVVNYMVEDAWRGAVEVAVVVEATAMVGPDRLSEWQKRERLVRLTCKGWEDKKRWVRIRCKGTVKVIFSSNSTYDGTLEKGPKVCKFEMEHP